MIKHNKLAFFTLFFLLLTLRLPAQIPDGAQIFVLPITGAGGKETQTFLYEKIIREVAFQGYPVSWTRRDSNFIISGAIHPVIEVSETELPPPSPKTEPRIGYAGNRREFLSWEVRNPVLFYDTSSSVNTPNRNPDLVLVLKLLDARDNELLMERQMVFNDLNNAAARGISLIITDFIEGNQPNEYISNDVEFIPAVLVQKLPEDPLDKAAVYSEDWRNRALFLKASVIWSPRAGDLPAAISNAALEALFNELSLFNFGLNFAAEVQFLPFMSFETGGQFIIYNAEDLNLLDVSAELPLALKLVFKPGEKAMLSVFGGAAYNTPGFLGKTFPTQFTYFAGLEAVIKSNTGGIVIEARYIKEFFDYNFDRDFKIQLGIGYKSGLFPKLERRLKDQ